MESRFEYQRHPAKWDEVDDNINKFKQAGLSNFSMQICTTINFFNVAHIDELAYKVKEWNPDFWFINIMHNPVEFDVQQIPIAIKQQIANKISKSTIYKKEIQTAIDYMMQEPIYKINDWRSKVKEKIVQIDSVRGENFKRTFPFLNNLVGIYE